MNLNTFKYKKTTDSIIRCFYDVYNELGYGFLESVYEKAMLHVLRNSGLEAEPQVAIGVIFRDMQVGHFRADLIVNQVVVLELKATKSLDSTHEAQLLNYLRATNLEVGLVLNFGPKPQLKRLVFDNNRKSKVLLP